MAKNSHPYVPADPEPVRRYVFRPNVAGRDTIRQWPEVHTGKLLKVSTLCSHVAQMPEILNSPKLENVLPKGWVPELLGHVLPAKVRRIVL